MTDTVLSVWDTSSILTLATSQAACDHCFVEGVLNGPAWGTVARWELQNELKRRPPTQGAAQALKLAPSLLGAPLAESDAEEKEVVLLRLKMTAGTSTNPNKNWGEAQAIVLALRYNAIVVTDDALARGEARAAGLRAVSLPGLLAYHVAGNKLAVGAALAMFGDFVTAGRLAAGLAPDVDLLKARGHIRIP